jgi:hypothetical protein
VGGAEWACISTSGYRHLVLEVGTRAGVTRVLVSADIVPGPAIGRALLHRGGIFEWCVVAQPVALIDDAPGITRFRLDGDACAIAEPGCIDLLVFALRIIGQDHGAPFLRVPGRAERQVLVDR